VQFVIDGKNFPVSFKQGSAEPGSRNRDNENATFITALNDAKSKSSTAEYPDLNKREKFSTLNVRDAVGAIVEGCHNAPEENQKFRAATSCGRRSSKGPPKYILIMRVQRKRARPGIFSERRQTRGLPTEE